MSKIGCTTVSKVPLLKLTEDFLEFKCYPKYNPYFNIKLAITIASLSLALVKRRRSCANKRRDKARVLRPMLMPWICPIVSALTSKREKTFNPAMNKKGDTGSPWRSLHIGLKYPYGEPFNRTQKDTVDKHCFTQMINC